MSAAILAFPRTPPEVAERRYQSALADLHRSYPEGCWKHLEEVLQSYGAFVASMYENRGAA